MDITIDSDPEHDQLYIALSSRSLKKGAVRRSVRVNENITLDYNARGKLLGIDITNASVVVGTRIQEPAVDALIGVKEAAEIAGVRPPNFVRDYADKPSFPKPVATLSSGRIWRRSDVVAYLGRRSRAHRKAS
jgi:uncharacterized protein YuzE/predicted DNA-binding transcriptional regulator AlpA